MIKRLLLFLKTIRVVESTLMCGFPLIGTMFALREWQPDTLWTIVKFVIATYGLVIYVYVLNSWGGLETDRLNKRLGEHPAVKGEITTQYLVRIYYTGLAVSFFLYILWFPQCFPIALAIACNWTLYSHPDVMAKGRPIVGNLVHFVGGVLQFLLGWVILSEINLRGLLLALYFAGIFAAGHLNHEVMDHDADKEMGLRTNAVIYGPRRMLNFAFFLFFFWTLFLAWISFKGIVPFIWAFPFLVVFPFHAIAHVKMKPPPGATYRRDYQMFYRSLYVLAGFVVFLLRFFQLKH